MSVAQARIATTAVGVEPIALSAREVSQMLGISVRQVWRLLAANELPRPRRVGARARWDRQELLSWWQDQ